jgi:Ca2+-binding EF-hand superfamily protein
MLVCVNIHYDNTNVLFWYPIITKQAFEGYHMDVETFRQQLRRGVACKLSVPETQSIMFLFDTDGNGLADGQEFLLTFYRFRFEHRQKLLTERIQAERKIMGKAKLRAKKRQEEFEKKYQITVDFDYTADERKSALDKMTAAAFQYDKQMPGCVQLNAFDGASMSPKIFKEQLKHVFGIVLSPQELGALMNFFDRDGDGMINCAEFLVAFFRMGFEERTKFVRNERSKKQKIKAEKERLEKEAKELLEQQNKMQVSYNYTEEDKVSAFTKLRDAARLYDRTLPGAVSMSGFDGAFMEPHVFKEQLRRVFNLKISAGELGVLMHTFDDDGDGTINCAEFTKNFLKMGFIERENEIRNWNKKQALADEKRREKERQKEEALAKFNSNKVNFEFSEGDFESAIQKLTEAAWKYDKNMPGAVSMVAFEGKSMEPHVFKEQLLRVLNMKLSPQELGALMSYFDKNGDGCISCSDFLVQFIKVGFEERSRRRQYYRQLEEQKAKSRQMKAEEKERIAEQKNNLKVSLDFEEHEFQSAIAKLTDAAVRYDRSTAGAVGLDAFEGEAMLPHVFKEQLKRVFNIRLSPPELGALMSYFDKDGDGYVNCSEFLIQFFRTGFEQRSKTRTYWRELKKSNAERKAKAEEDRLKENEARAMADVDYNFSEDHFDSALMMMIKMCYQFEHRQLGPAGLKAFEADMVTPSEFREMLKRSFNMLVNSHQLGALVTYWDPGMIGMVSCRAFLNSFTQMRVRTEPFKNKPGEARKLQEYHAELKEKYKQRIQKQMNNNDVLSVKPWRNNSVATFSAEPVAKKPYPATPGQKAKRRLNIARKTGRLDLSTQCTRPESESGGGGGGDENSSNGQGNSASAAGSGAGGKTQLGSGDSCPPTTQDILATGPRKSTVEYFLEELPAETFMIKGLRELWLCNNPLRGVVSPKLSELSNLRTLSLQNTGLTAFPKEVFSLVLLQQLYLQRNTISVVPDEISSLSVLNYLNLSRNSFTGSIPTNLVSLKNLLLLDMSNNAVEVIPTELTSMPALTLLNLDFTSVVEVPEVITRRMPSLIVSGVAKEKTKIKYTPQSYGISAEEEKEFVGFIKMRCKKSKESKAAAAGGGGGGAKGGGAESM